MIARRKNGRSPIVPLVGIAMGALALGIQVALGDVGKGLAFLAIMVGYTAILWFGGNAEDATLLRGDGNDERQRAIMMKSHMVTAQVMVWTAVIGAFAEMASGQGYGHFGVMCSVGGAAFIGSTMWFRRTT